MFIRTRSYKINPINSVNKLSCSYPPLETRQCTCKVQVNAMLKIGCKFYVYKVVIVELLPGGAAVHHVKRWLVLNELDLLLVLELHPALTDFTPVPTCLHTALKPNSN